MTKKLNWKLKQLPTASEVADLVDKKIITAQEAKDMLFSDFVPESSDPKKEVDALKKQIEFLEELVKELSKNRGQVLTPVYIDRWVRRFEPYTPYWMSTGGTTVTSAATSGKGTLTVTNYANKLLN